MSQDQLTAQLLKAAGNLKKLNEFFAARQSWPVAGDAEERAREFADAAEAVDKHLKELVTSCGAEPIAPAEPQVKALSPGELDANRLGRFASFLRDLDEWFNAQTDLPTEPEGVEALREMESFLASTVELAGAITAPPPTPAATHAVPVPATVAMGGPPGPEEPPPQADPSTTQPIDSPAELPQPSADVDPDAPPRLVLDDTDEEPMTQEFKDVVELTPLCEQRVDEYLGAWGIQYSHISRKKFLERLLKWISGAPEGTALVLKMGIAGEQPEPFPAYVSRDVLAGRVPPE
jgi:hypothetical protein